MNSRNHKSALRTKLLLLPAWSPARTAPAPSSTDNVWFLIDHKPSPSCCETHPPSHPDLLSLKPDEVDKKVKNVISHPVCLNKLF